MRFWRGAAGTRRRFAGSNRSRSLLKSGLRDIWSMHSITAMAALSLTVVAAFAAVLTAVSIRVFNRSAVR